MSVEIIKLQNDYDTLYNLGDSIQKDSSELLESIKEIMVSGFDLNESRKSIFVFIYGFETFKDLLADYFMGKNTNQRLNLNEIKSKSENIEGFYNFANTCSVRSIFPEVKIEKIVNDETGGKIEVENSLKCENVKAFIEKISNYLKDIYKSFISMCAEKKMDLKVTIKIEKDLNYIMQKLFGYNEYLTDVMDNRVFKQLNNLTDEDIPVISTDRKNSQHNHNRHNASFE